MENNNQLNHKPNFMALTPLILFLVLYLGTSLLLNDFYKVPITVAFAVSSLYAILITRGVKLEERINLFSKGAGDKTLLLMVWIFILAGAFAKSAKEMGAVESVVNLTLNILPANFLLPGLFLAACFISLSIGTSVGTIAALTPVAVGMAGEMNTSIAFVLAIIVGGAYFGDNLSFISDTTIIATKSQGCKMSDKFKVNIFIVAPAAIIMLIYYLMLGQDVCLVSEAQNVEWIKIIPYIVVLLTALFGVNVMVVLTIGLLLCGVIGITTGSYDFFGWLAAMGEGVISMSELIIVTLLAGGMLELISYNGGLAFLTEKLTKRVKGKRGCELCIALLVALSDFCTANNTVAIITVGPIAKSLAEKYDVDPRRSASILDTFSCFAQGIIPYGAQMLIAAGLASLQPNEIARYMYYPILVGIIALVAILLRYPKMKTSN